MAKIPDIFTIRSDCNEPRREPRVRNQSKERSSFSRYMIPGPAGNFVTHVGSGTLAINSIKGNPSIFAANDMDPQEKDLTNRGRTVQWELLRLFDHGLE